TPRSRTCTSSGESVDAMKLNCPIGQTNLQNEACLNTPSTTSTAAKYPTISQAVHHGDAHKSNSSYTNKTPANSATAIHLFRNACGQLINGRRNFRAALRTSMNGHARQKKFPAATITSTNAPRKCTHVSTVARFFGASDGPNNPCRIITTLKIKRGICS